MCFLYPLRTLLTDFAMVQPGHREGLRPETSWPPLRASQPGHEVATRWPPGGYESAARSSAAQLSAAWSSAARSSAAWSSAARSSAACRQLQAGTGGYELLPPRRLFLRDQLFSYSSKKFFGSDHFVVTRQHKMQLWLL